MLAYFAKLRRAACCYRILVLFYVYEISSINIRALTTNVYYMHYVSVCCYVDVYAQVHM